MSVAPGSCEVLASHYGLGAQTQLQLRVMTYDDNLAFFEYRVIGDDFLLGLLGVDHGLVGVLGVDGSGHFGGFRWRVEGSG